MTTATTPYTPAPHSLAAKMLSFFERAPDEHLTLEDIVEKFDVTRGNIHTMLTPAVTAGLMQRSVNDDADYIYHLPRPALRVMRDSYSPPAPSSLPNVTPPAKLPRARKASAVITDPDSLQITDDPLPAGRASPGFKYQAVLSKLQRGQCIKCQPAEIGRVCSAMRKHLTIKGENFAVRTIKNYGDGMGRVWWLPGNGQAGSAGQKTAGA